MRPGSRLAGGSAMSTDGVFCSCHDDSPARRELDPMGPHTYVTMRSVYYGVKPSNVRGPKRDRYLVDVRRKIATELRAEPWRLSFPAIGQALGGRDHSTIIHLLKKNVDG